MDAHIKGWRSNGLDNVEGELAGKNGRKPAPLKAKGAAPGGRTFR